MSYVFSILLLLVALIALFAGGAAFYTGWYLREIRRGAETIDSYITGTAMIVLAGILLWLATVFWSK